MNWLLIITAAILVVSIIVGFYRGAIKIVVSLAATIVTLLLTTFLTPYVADGLAKATKLDTVIEEQVMKAMTNYATDTVAENGAAGLSVDAIKKALSAAGVTEEMLEEQGISISDIQSGKVDKETLNKMGISEQVLDGLKAQQDKVEDALSEADIPRDVQMKAIENADIPQIFKDLLTENNNQTGYDKLGVNTFAKFAAKFLSKLVLQVIAFMAIFVLLTIVFRAIIFALDVVSNLPVVGALNRLAGGILGAVGALFIVWFIFAVLTLLYAAGIGKGVYALIQQSNFLAFLYEYNPIMKLMLKM